MEEMPKIANSKYPNVLMQGLSRLREDNYLCDVTFTVGGKIFPAHRAVLASSCNYFRVMFTSGFKEESADDIPLYGSAEAFELLLEFAYTGCLNVDKMIGHIHDVLDLAYFVQFEELVESSVECALRLFESQPDNVTVREAWKVSTLARGHRLSGLLEASLKYLEDNVGGLKDFEIFLQDADVTFLVQFLDREYLSNEHEETQVLEIVCNWLKYDWTTRSQHATQRLQKVRLGLVEFEDLQNLLGPEILGIDECSNMFGRVIDLRTSNTSKDALAVENPSMFMARSAITAPIASREGNTFEYYCQRSRSWMDMERMAPLPQKNKSFPIIAINCSLYAAGGISDDSRAQNYQGKTDFHRYSMLENRWYELPPMPTGRLYFPLVSTEGYVYAIGGSVHGLRGTATNLVERFNLAENSWEAVASLPRTCNRLSAVVFRGKIIVYGMKHFYENPNTSEHSVMIYEPEKNVWQVTDLANQEEFITWKSELFCHGDKCYRVMFRHNYAGRETVNHVEFNSTGDDTIGVEIGDSVDQDHIPEDRGVFRIGYEVFVLINRFICPTNIRIPREQLGDVDVGLWRRSRYLGVETSNVTSFTFDRKKLSNGKTLT